MSQYVNFYFKGGDKFYPIDDFSRSTVIYSHLADYLPYESGEALTEKLLLEVLNDIKESIDYYTESMSKLIHKKSDILHMNGDVNDKLEALDEVNNEIECIQRDKEEVKSALSFYRFLLNIVQNAQYIEDIDSDKYIWAGIEWNPNYKED